MKVSCTTLGNTQYHDKFIRNFSSIITPLEELLCKYAKYIWMQEFQQVLGTLKEKLMFAPILIFPEWSHMFHVYVDASLVSLGVVLAQPGEGELDYPICFGNRKIYIVENNYTKDWK